MPKTLNELAGELKALIIDLQSDPHNKTNINSQRYNNLKLGMEIAKESTPHVIVNIAMSEAVFNINNGEKMSGGLGPDERYVLRWFSKGSTMEALKECWKSREKSRGKAEDGEE